MSRLRQLIICLVAMLAMAVVHAQNPPLPPNLIPTIPTPGLSPVTLFRNLLAMAPSERANYLSNRPPEIRGRILAKIHEYLILGPDERELRLQATELRWYLMPLLSLSLTNRAERLAQIPENLQSLVKNRLAQWDILPPPLRQELLDNDRALHYFANIMPPGAAKPDAFPDGQRRKIAEQFNQFFELTSGEKEKTLKTLSAAERAQMEKTLQSFAHLPPSQRMLCLRNYEKFAGMSSADRAEFLKNAEHWSQMLPADRQAWRDLVAHVPAWPPMPPPPIPAKLMPHAPLIIHHPNVATN
ncbi:MAG TPA: DUF3106 domain-containing protein [Verrucomicrobiae bacterium]|jgi:hypothetical protein